MFDIVSVGEVLIDLTQSGENALGIPRFDANPGGAPANLAVAASRLGAKTAFIGKVGDDSFGRFLRRCLEENGVDVSGLAVDEKLRTTLAVVAVDENGERDFSFYRNPGADVNLSERDIPQRLLREGRFVHFGGVSLTDEPARGATLFAVETAKAHGALVSYDPNYRANLWESERSAAGRLLAPVPMADVLKVSDSELCLLTGTADLEAGSAQLAGYGVPLVIVTLGGEGAFYRFMGRTGLVPGVRCEVCDTNGAGDTFLGALLSRLAVRRGLEGLGVSELEEIIAFANRAAAVTVSRHGAIPAMPRLCELGI